MIRPLRRRHGRVMLVLAVVLPLVYALALVSRPAPPLNDQIIPPALGRLP